MDQETLLTNVVRRLDILIALQLEAAGGPEGQRPSAKIRRLSEVGLSPSEVAAVLGKPLNYVTATLSRKARAKKGKEEHQ